MSSAMAQYCSELHPFSSCGDDAYQEHAGIQDGCGRGGVRGQSGHSGVLLSATIQNGSKL